MFLNSYSKEVEMSNKYIICIYVYIRKVTRLLFKTWLFLKFKLKYNLVFVGNTVKLKMHSIDCKASFSCPPNPLHQGNINTAFISQANFTLFPLSDFFSLFYILFTIFMYSLIRRFILHFIYYFRLYESDFF